MNIEEVRDYCLSLRGADESFPFGDDTLVFKVMGKIFCLMNLDGEPGINLKNQPEKIMEMREDYPFVVPGYHMNKVHWNTVRIEYAPETLVQQWISESYKLVVEGLTRKQKEELTLYGNERI